MVGTFRLVAGGIDLCFWLLNHVSLRRSCRLSVGSCGAVSLDRLLIDLLLLDWLLVNLLLMDWLLVNLLHDWLLVD